MLCAAPDREVYRRVPVGVNRSGPLRGACGAPTRVLAAGALLWIAAGCASAPTPAVRPYVIAVRYDVEPVFVGQARHEAMNTVRNDFATLASLGFTTAWLRHVDDPDRGMLLELARETGLALALTDRAVEHFVVAGTLPAGRSRVDDVVEALPRTLLQHAALDGLLLGGGSGDSAAHRATQVGSVLTAHGIAWIRASGPSTGDGGVGPALASIDLGDMQQAGDASLVQRYLARFHAGLTAGRTAGLVVDRYRRLTGDPPGLIAGQTPLPPAKAAAIKKLLTRARKWGPRLCQLAASPLTEARTLPPGLQVTVLVRGRRRYVLVFNPSLAHHGRGNVRLPESIGDAPVIRAVEVPPSASLATGQVLEAQRGRITLPVTLRPGDAALFEVF